MNLCSRRFCAQVFSLAHGFVILAFLLGTGCVNRGYISLAMDDPISNRDTRLSLEEQGKLVEKAAAEISGSQVQQSFSERAAVSTRLSISNQQLNQARGGDVGTTESAEAETPLDVPGHEDKITLPERPFARLDGSAYAGRYQELLNDLKNKYLGLARIKSNYLGLAHSGDLNTSLYRIDFRVSIDPERQHYLSYLYRWIDPFDGFRNYTKDYSAELHIIIPKTIQGGGTLRIVKVEPESEYINSVEGLSLNIHNQLGLAYAQADLAAALDFQNMREQEFAELRKHPLIVGTLDSPHEATFLFNPRRKMVERSGLGRLFISNYKIVRQLDENEKKVSIYVEVNNPSNSALKDRSDVDTMFGNLNTKITKAKISTNQTFFLDETLTQEGINEASLETLKAFFVDEHSFVLPITTFANYRELGNPKKSDLLPFKSKTWPRLVSSSNEQTLRWDGQRDVRLLEADIPVESKKSDTLIAHFDSSDTVWKVNLKWDNHDLRSAIKTIYRINKLKEWKKVPVEMLEFNITSPSDIVYLLSPLPEEKDCVVGYVVTARLDDEYAVSAAAPYNGLSKKPELNPVKISPGFGFEGAVVEITLPAESEFKSAPKVIMFGNKEAKILKKNDKPPFKMEVLSPKNNVPLVSVTAHSEESGKPIYMKLGEFNYLLTP